MEDQDNMLRKIANDSLTPKNTKKTVNTDSLF